MPRYKIMAEAVTDIVANLTAVRNGIKQAAEIRPASAHIPDPILVAVSKTKPLVSVKKAYDAGQRHFGENYLKELILKSSNPDIEQLCPEIKWHYIGSFTKKQASVLMRVKNLHMLQTLNGCQEADAVNSRWSKTAEPLRVMIQVNTSGESNKSGVTPDKCKSVAEHIINNCPRLKLSGIMTIGAIGYDYSKGPNPDFESLRQCRDEICASLNLPKEQLDLSMGMSNDYKEAIAAGSTYVRVGSNIFGARE